MAHQSCLRSSGRAEPPTNCCTVPSLTPRCNGRAERMGLMSDKPERMGLLSEKRWRASSRLPDDVPSAEGRLASGTSASGRLVKPFSANEAYGRRFS
jgi:hypothetical protein